MADRLFITALVENTVTEGGLLAEHGASFWVERGGRCILFDTGQGMSLGHNAQRLGIPIWHQTEAVVLSHGHYDHSGGLGEFLTMCPKAVLHAHPAAFEPRYSRNADGDPRSVGMKGSREDRKAWKHLSIATTVPTEIIPGVFVTGPVPRETSFEDTGDDFYLDEACTQPDPMVDDQSLFCRTADGLVVLLGCAHAGVVNTLRYIHTLAGGVPIEAVIGGMHLVRASSERIQATLADLRALGVRRIYPSHCTGPSAVAEMRKVFRDDCLPCRVGTRLEFPIA
ncbi:MAG: MBL fold metallo-hydrolase [Phycisphaerae bacterium]|nr:MBL fold metallo-hydrolase [Phycisphaerae bacterium]